MTTGQSTIIILTAMVAGLGVIYFVLEDQRKKVLASKVNFECGLNIHTGKINCEVTGQDYIQ